MKSCFIKTLFIIKNKNTSIHELINRRVIIIKECGFCGNVNPDYLHICIRCGNPLNESDNIAVDENKNMNVSNNSNSSKGNNTFIIAAIVIILILVALSAVLSLQSSQNGVYTDNINQVISHEEQMIILLNNSDISHLDITNSQEVNSYRNTFSNASEVLNDDITLLNQLNESTTDEDKKEYLQLHLAVVSDLKELYDKLIVLMDITLEYNSNKIGQEDVTESYSDTIEDMILIRRNLDNDSDRLQSFMDAHPNI